MEALRARETATRKAHNLQNQVQFLGPLRHVVEVTDRFHMPNRVRFESFTCHSILTSRMRIRTSLIRHIESNLGFAELKKKWRFAHLALNEISGESESRFAPMGKDFALTLANRVRICTRYATQPLANRVRICAHGEQRRSLVEATTFIPRETSKLETAPGLHPGTRWVRFPGLLPARPTWRNLR